MCPAAPQYRQRPSLRRLRFSSRERRDLPITLRSPCRNSARNRAASLPEAALSNTFLISSENDWNEVQQGSFCSQTVVPQRAARPESSVMTNAIFDSSVGNDDGWRNIWCRVNIWQERSGIAGAHQNKRLEVEGGVRWNGPPDLG